MKALACLLVLLLCASARADALPDPDVEVARRHYNLGIERYDAGDYAAAIAEFRAANTVRPRAAFDYNIARCYDRLGNWTRALDYYRRFMRDATPAEQTDEIRRRIVDLDTRVRIETPPPAPIVHAPGPRIAAVVIGAAAVASLAVGGALFGWARADLPSRRDYCRSLPRECVPSEWTDLSTRANASYALFAIGGALAVADIALWATDTSKRKRTEAWLAPAPRGLVVGGSF